MRALLVAGAAAVLVGATLAGGVAQAGASGVAPTTGKVGAAAIGSRGVYSSVDRVRALDTRTSRPLSPHATSTVHVTGIGQVPATGAVAVSVNLTVLGSGTAGSLSAFEHGTSFAGATMSFQPGINQNFETVPVDGAGLIELRNNAAGPINLIVDVFGYYGPSTDPNSGGQYQPMTPTRLLDTRTGTPVGSHQTRAFVVSGRAGIP